MLNQRGSRLKRATGRYSLFGIILLLGILILTPLLFPSTFSSSGFMPHAHCYLQLPGMMWLQGSSDLLIGLSYVAISFALAYLLYQIREMIPFSWMIAAFGIFIIACGSTHFMEVWTLWNPDYWVAGGLKAITAAASMITALALPPLIPNIVRTIEAAHLSERRRSELEELYSRVKELDETKSRFFANVSHELRTPITLIRGPLEQILVREDLPADVRRSLEGAVRNMNLLNRQVENLLDISRLDAGKMAIARDRFDLSQLARTTVNTIESYALTRDVDISFEEADVTGSIIEGDDEKLQRVLLNLISNAIRYAPAESSIRVSISTSEDLIFLDVADAGPGIAPEDRERVFGRYERVERTGTSSEGTGLGLAIAQEIIHLHGGTITIEDAPEGGALFRVALPLSADQTSPVVESEIVASQIPEISRERSDERPATASGSPLPSILVLEDNLEIQELIGDFLRNDYQLAFASNGEEGLEYLDNVSPDLVITDIMMPGMDGIEFLTRFNARYPDHSIPVLILSARGEEEVRLQLLSMGADDYISKPFSRKELHLRVESLVERKLSQDLLEEELAESTSNLHEMAQKLEERRHDLEVIIDELRVSRSRFERLWNSGIIGLGISDPLGQIVDANDTFLQMLGYDNHDFSVRPLNYYELTPEVDRNKTTQALDSLLARGAVSPFEKTYQHRDGHIVPVLLGAARIEGTQGEPEQIFFCLDLTRQKQAEHEISVLNRELENRVQQRTAALEGSNRELEAYSYSVSHDLRAPLRAIKGFTGILREEINDRLDEDEKGYFDRIERNVEQMNNLIEALLNVSRLTQAPLNRREIDLGELASDVLRQMRETEPDRSIEFVNQDGMKVTADPNLLRIVLENLIGNALKFTKGEATARLTLTAEGVGAYARFILEDNGVGFDQERQEELFQPFRRLHSDQEFSGTGIGLATVRRIIIRHGGTIRAESDPEGSARFIFTLPAS